MKRYGRKFIIHKKVFTLKINTFPGLSHIKFWKMATTFTGLKLQGELGRFGKTEYSDICGVLPMPDEKVGNYKV